MEATGQRDQSKNNGGLEKLQEKSAFHVLLLLPLQELPLHTFREWQIVGEVEET